MTHFDNSHLAFFRLEIFISFSLLLSILIYLHLLSLYNQFLWRRRDERSSFELCWRWWHENKEKRNESFAQLLIFRKKKKNFQQIQHGREKLLHSFSKIKNVVCKTRKKNKNWIRLRSPIGSLGNFIKTLGFYRLW